MKKTIKSILALALVLCMLFSAVGCGEGGTSSDEQQVAAGDDFFTDTKTDAATDDGNSSQSGTSSASGSTSSTGTTSSNKTGTTKVPDANKTGGKTWKELLQTMPKNLRGTTVTVYNWNPASEYTGAPAVIKEFERQTNIKVNWKTVTYNTYFTKLAALISSGENIPDVARIRGDGQFTFIQNFQPISNVDFDFTDEAWDQTLMDLYTYGKNTYAVNLQGTHIGGVSMMFYNKTLVNKFDMEDPYKLWKNGKWTWNKYIKMCREFVDEAGSGYHGSCGEGHFGHYYTSWGLSGAIAYNGSKFYNASKKSDFLEVTQKLGDFYNKENLFLFGNAESFNSDKVLFSIGTAVHLRKKNSYFGNLKNSNTLMAVPMPSIDGQKKYYQGLGEAEAYGIVKGAPNKEAVPYFLRFFLDASNYDVSEFFGNKQNLEVYNWCMNQKNKVRIYGYPSDNNYGSVDKGIQSKTAAQVKSYIDANSGVVDKTVKEYNAIVTKLKK